MNSLKQVPLLKILFLFVSGIILMEYSECYISRYNYLIISSIIILTLLSVFFLRTRYKLLLNILLALIIILSGMENHFLQDERNAKNHFSKISISKKDYFISKIISKKKTTSGTSFIVKIKSIISKDNIAAASGNLLIYTKCDFDSCDLIKADVIQIPAVFFPINKNKNPLAFNPRKYYHFQNIHFSSFTDKAKIKIIKKGKSQFMDIFTSLRNNIKSQIGHLIADDTVKNIAISIMLGDKQNLDRSVLNTFSSTGTRHILTVSGMHAGIIALILNFLFSFIKSRNKLIATIKIALILTGIWFYVFLTGAGAAVMRAAFMISLIMIGINLRRYINILNILFGSALIILLFNPFQLFQLGFILSYTAMLSILLFYQPVYNFLKPKNKIIKYLWQLISLSLAAQILIFPLSLYFFHNAPVLFFITAIIATPMAFSTIFLGFSAFIMNAFLYFPAKAIAKILEIIIRYCLDFIEYIQSISINIAQYIYIDYMDILIIGFSLSVLIFLLKYKKTIFKYAFAISFLLLILHQYTRYISNQKNDEIVIYSTHNTMITDIFLSGKLFTYSNGNSDKNRIKYATYNYRNYKGNTLPNILTDEYIDKHLSKNKNIINVNGKTIVFINSENDYLPKSKEKIDYLVIDGNIKLDTDKLLDNYRITKIILSDRTKYNNRYYWKKIANSKNIEVWDIKEKGAFIEKLNNKKDV